MGEFIAGGRYATVYRGTLFLLGNKRNISPGLKSLLLALELRILFDTLNAAKK